MTMMQACRIAMPWWLIVIVVIEVLPMFAGPYVALTRPAFMGGPEAETINQAAHIYAARNFAVGLALILAAVLRNAPMLFVLILVRLLTDLYDLPTLITFELVKNVPLNVGIFVLGYYLPALWALYWLWQRMTGTAVAAARAA